MASRSWNRVELIGNLTRDPELRYTPNGAAVCTFGIATNRTFVTEGEKKEEVDFHRLVAWNKLAELCNQLLKKGNRVFVSGRLQTRSWEGQDGQTRQVTEIVIEDMILLTPKGNSDYMSVPANADVEPVKKEESASQRISESVADEESEKEVEEIEEKEPKAAEKTPPKEEVEDDLPF
ncbi:MAG: single-stranded DNA-binding protein [Candidatus Daviesbacteria bacterium]|nr:single-stranded DNA-binding protein [Candidatus Daviesbacteria bacterium]